MIKEKLFCVICGKELQGNQKMYCSNSCKQKNQYKKEVNNNTAHSQDRRGIIRKLELLQRVNSKCSICGYNKNIAALEFHHVDATTKEFSLDRRVLSNLSMEKIEKEFIKCIVVCANCHREIHNPESEYTNAIKFKEDNINNLNLKTLNKDYIKDKNHCSCGKEISYDAKKCIECSNKSKQIVNRPSREDLLQLIKTNTFVSLSKQFGVSDNAIRKWCKAYDLPFKQKILNY